MQVSLNYFLTVLIFQYLEGITDRSDESGFNLLAVKPLFSRIMWPNSSLADSSVCTYILRRALTDESTDKKEMIDDQRSRTHPRSSALKTNVAT